MKRPGRSIDAVLEDIRRLLIQYSPIPPILTLPNEILLRIIGELDIQTTIILRKTCKRLCILTPPWQDRLRIVTPRLPTQDPEAVASFLEALEKRTVNEYRFACFCCLNLQPYHNFLDKKLKLYYDKRRERAPRVKHRLCLTCQEENIHPGNSFLIGGGMMAKGFSCEQLVIDFCLCTPNRHAWCRTCVTSFTGADITKVLEIKRNSGKELKGQPGGTLVMHKTITSHPCRVEAGGDYQYDGKHYWNLRFPIHARASLSNEKLETMRRLVWQRYPPESYGLLWLRKASLEEVLTNHDPCLEIRYLFQCLSRRLIDEIE